MEIEEKLTNLEYLIESKEYLKNLKSLHNWNGADVVISPRMTENITKWLDKENLIISAQKTVPRKRAVITNYSKELSWLFNELKKIFLDKIDYISKYDFYGSLAQAAIDYIESTDKVERETLLLTVLDQARKFN